MQGDKGLMHPIYLPFTEAQLKSRFAKVGKNEDCAPTADKHIEYYKKSLRNYEEYLRRNPDRKAKPISELKVPCQIEKDERFWIAACMMTILFSENRLRELTDVFKHAYGSTPPIAEIDSWEECFEGLLDLFFEPNLPSPAPYKEWLFLNCKKRHLIPYILDSAYGKKNLEGPTNVDAMLLNAPNGFAVVIEAKVLSDISYQITYDVIRNQIARNIDVMLENNPELCEPLKHRDPEKTLFLLVTPRIFKNNPTTRLYGYKFNEYKNDPSCLGRDLPHRTGCDLESISRRLGWLTWEDFKDVNQNCCKWLE